jgi:hypothetical protein
LINKPRQQLRQLLNRLPRNRQASRNQREDLKKGAIGALFYSRIGTPGKCLADRMVSDVFTLATFGAAVSWLVRKL